MFRVKAVLTILVFSLVRLRQTFAERNIAISAKIVGGNETTVEQFQYAVSIRNTFYGGRYEKNVCCGSIISENWVLTSAHCVNGFKQNCTNLAVRVGKSNNNQGKIHSVSEVVIHPHYSYSKVPRYNVGILKVKTPFVYSIRVQPVRIAPADFVPAAGALASVLGWGASQEGGNDFDFLHQVSVPILPRGECAKYYTDYEDYDGSEVINDDVFCAGVKEGGKGFCENDNGGPLVYNSTQVGVVSWSSGCADKEYPGVYSNVSFFSDWISSVTGIGLHNTTTAMPTTQATNGVPLSQEANHYVLLFLTSLFILMNAVTLLE